MDVLSSGYMNTSAGKQGLLIVDNTGKQAPDFGHGVYLFNKFVNDTSFETSSIPSQVLYFLSVHLEEENFYNPVTVAPDSWLRPVKTEQLDFFRTDELNNLQKNVLKDSTDADLWISLDKLVTKTKTDVQNIAGMYHASRDVIVNTVWHVMDANADTLCLVFQHNDSLYWEDWNETARSAVRLLPDFEETVPEIADYIAERVYKIFGPYWQPVERFYYVTGGYRMKFAADCIKNNDWEGASELWQEEFDKGFGRSVYRSAMNMMLYYEYQDKPEEALIWGERAKTSFDSHFMHGSAWDRQVLSAYITYLQRRKEELSKLNSIRCAIIN
jgi:hypothetical protein